MEILRRYIPLKEISMRFEQCRSIHTIMSGFDYPWFFAGGWALDLYCGRETREHKDVEIAMFRKDQLHLKKYLTGWDFQKVDLHSMSPWEGDFLVRPIHEIHASNKDTGEVLEILLNEGTEREWIFRRNNRIKLPKDAVWCYAESGLPVLNPEIVLLYKAKNTREKDNQDFFIMKDYLNKDQKTWLRQSVLLQHPKHEWLEYLK
jgi:hypothetical protein